MTRRLAALALAAACALLAAVPESRAQEIVVQGIRIQLTDQDRAWLARYCERRNLAAGSEQHRRCVADMGNDILQQRARDAITRPGPSGP